MFLLCLLVYNILTSISCHVHVLESSVNLFLKNTDNVATIYVSTTIFAEAGPCLGFLRFILLCCNESFCSSLCIGLLCNFGCQINNSWCTARWTLVIIYSCVLQQTISAFLSTLRMFDQTFELCCIDPQIVLIFGLPTWSRPLGDRQNLLVLLESVKSSSVASSSAAPLHDEIASFIMPLSKSRASRVGNWCALIARKYSSSDSHLSWYHYCLLVISSQHWWYVDSIFISSKLPALASQTLSSTNVLPSRMQQRGRQLLRSVRWRINCYNIIVHMSFLCAGFDRLTILLCQDAGLEGRRLHHQILYRAYMTCTRCIKSMKPGVLKWSTGGVVTWY